MPVGIRPDDLIGHLALTGQRRCNVNRRLGVGIVDRPARRSEPLRGQCRRDDLLADAVGRQPLPVDIDRYLLLLHAVGAQVRDRFDAAQPVAQPVHVLLEFAVGARVGLERDEQRRGVAEIVVGDQRDDSGRQLGLERGETVLDLRPHFVLVVDIVVEFDHDVAHAVLRRGGGLAALDLLVGHQELFERPGQLLFDLFARGAGIEADDHALPDRVFGELLLGDARQGVDAEDEEAPHDEEGDAEIPHGPRNDVIGSFHRSTTLEP